MFSFLRTRTTVRLSAVVILIVVVGGLAWWYFFLSAQREALQAADAGRGAGNTAPSFGDLIGSTYSNIVTGLSNRSASDKTSDETEVPRLWQVSSSPVAGVGFVGNATSTTVRFVERGSGYVLEADPKTGALLRVTNTLVPQVYEALVGKNGVVVLRSLNESGAVVTSASRATTTPAADEVPLPLTLSPLPEGIRSMAISPTGDEVLYVSASPTGAALVRSAWNGTSAKEMTRVGLSGWAIQWPSPAEIVLAQYPTNAPSYVYQITGGGILSPLLPRGTHLEALPHPTTSALLYSFITGGLTLWGQTGSNTTAIALPVKTEAHKCVWAPAGQNPLGGTGAGSTAYCAVPRTLPESGAWEKRLRGEVNTTDSWWRVDVGAGRAELLYEPEVSLRLDVEKPVIDEKGEYIAFINAVDKSLWLLRITE